MGEGGKVRVLCIDGDFGNVVHRRQWRDYVGMVPVEGMDYHVVREVSFFDGVIGYVLDEINPKKNSRGGWISWDSRRFVVLGDDAVREEDLIEEMVAEAMAELGDVPPEFWE